MRERVEQVVGFCFDLLKEIGIASIVLHLLVHELTDVIVNHYGYFHNV